MMRFMQFLVAMLCPLRSWNKVPLQPSFVLQSSFDFHGGQRVDWHPPQAHHGRGIRRAKLIC